MRLTWLATRAGSSGSLKVGTPVWTLQKPQRRVQTSPRIMNVAVPRSQHSPTLGQFASSHTVCSPSAWIACFRRRYVGPPGAGTFSQGGLRSRKGRPSRPRAPPGWARERVTCRRGSVGAAASMLLTYRHGRGRQQRAEARHPPRQLGALDLHGLATVGLAEAPRRGPRERVEALRLPKLAGERGHAAGLDSAGDDPLERLEVVADVHGEAVRGDPAVDVDADRGDLARAPGGGRGGAQLAGPDPRQPVYRPGCYAEVAERGDDRALHPAHVIVHVVAQRPQAHDRVAD